MTSEGPVGKEVVEVSKASLASYLLVCNIKIKVLMVAGEEYGMP
jgi:hypothetical protein